MSSSRLLRWLAVIFVSVTVCGAYRQTSGAEVRTTARNQTICRTVSAEEPARAWQTPAKELAVEAGPTTLAMAVPEPMGADACMLCGTAGCEMECVRSCGRWARIEYLLWWRRGQQLPALVTSSPSGTSQAEAGVLGFDDTTTLYGGDSVGEEARPGGRVSVGAWLDPWGCHSVEGRFFAIGQQATTVELQSDGATILARPFSDGIDQQSLLLAFPGFTTAGSIQIRSESDVLGGDVLYRWLAGSSGNTRLDLLAGYQFARIDESLGIVSSTRADNIPLVDPGTTISIADIFETRNEFHGGQIGLAVEHDGPGWRMEFLAKVAFGNMREAVSISGQTLTVTPPPNVTTDEQDFGLLAQGANLGQHARNTFAVCPELGMTFAYQLSECLELSAGYSCIFWSNVAQPAGQIDSLLTVPVTQFAIQDNDFWLHGLNLGAELRF